MVVVVLILLHSLRHTGLLGLLETKLNGDPRCDLPFKLRLRGSAGGPLTSFASLFVRVPRYVRRRGLHRVVREVEDEASGGDSAPFLSA